MNDSFDVAIVGGGPAGAVCALELALAGINVIVIHIDRYQMEVIELISGKAKKLIEGLVQKPLLGIVEGVEVWQTISLWHGSSPLVLPAINNPWGSAMAVVRKDFDKRLRNLAGNAGAIILSNSIVRKAVAKAGKWELIVMHNKQLISLYANIVVLATGREGARIFGYPPVAYSPIIALMQRVSTVKKQNDPTLYIEAVANGWWYSLPCINGDRFLGFCGDYQIIKDRNLALQKLFYQELIQTRLINNHTYYHNYKLMARRLTDSHGSVNIAGSRWLAVGDAAFSPDPLSGKGIEFAIESAIICVKVITGKHDINDYVKWIQKYSTRHLNTLSIYLNSVNVIKE